MKLIDGFAWEGLITMKVDNDDVDAILPNAF
jgi:hypothetical protein